MIKWIGQHIVSLIARFRDDVYLENLEESTQDHVVSIDANGKLYKQDKATGDIESVGLTVDDGSSSSITSGNANFSILGGEGIDTTLSVSSVTISGEDASTSNKGVASFSSSHFDVSSGAVSIKDGGVDLTGDKVTGTLPVGKGGTGLTSISTLLNSNTDKADVGLDNVDNTSDANKPISTATQTALNAKAPTASPTFTGTVSGITAAMVGLDAVENKSSATIRGEITVSDIPTGSINISSLNNDNVIDTISITADSSGRIVSGQTTAAFTFNGLNGMTVTHVSGGQFTFANASASESAVGVVELATTGEADTGTDTARAVTPAGLKSHVDARIIPWLTLTGQFNPGSSDKYYAPSNQGALNTSWTGTGVSGGVDHFVDTGANANKVPFFKQNGIIIPSACTIVSMRGYVRYGVSKSYKFKFIKLAAADIKYNTNGTPQGTAICEATVTFTDNNTSRYAPMSFDGSVSLAQGDMIIPMIKNTDGDYSANTHFQFSFSIKV